MQVGVCRNPACRLSVTGERVERYPGPGEFCPGCGERLASLASSPPTAPALPVEIDNEAYAKFHSHMAEALFPQHEPPRRRQWILFASIALVFIAILVIAAIRAKPVGSSAVVPVHVCDSSITRGLAADVVRTYATATRLAASRFNFAESRSCDVRFAAATSPAQNGLIAHDAIVVVVNPANRLTHIGEAELRRILSGGETAWGNESGVAGAIVPIVPDEGTDEAKALAAFLHGTKLAPSVRRASSSADVARAVAAAGGRRSIGIVAFSAAAPAKVLALDGRPTPSALTIADHRYPFSLDISVSDDSRLHDSAARGLAQYARSDDAQSVVVRNGLIAKKGF